MEGTITTTKEIFANYLKMARLDQQLDLDDFLKRGRVLYRHKKPLANGRNTIFGIPGGASIAYGREPLSKLIVGEWAGPPVEEPVVRQWMGEAGVVLDEVELVRNDEKGLLFRATPNNLAFVGVAFLPRVPLKYEVSH